MSTLHAVTLIFPFLASIWFGLWPLVTGRARRKPAARAGLPSFSFNLSVMALLQTLALITPDAGLRRVFFQLSFFALALIPWLWPIVGVYWHRQLHQLHPGVAFSAATSASLFTVLVLTNDQNALIWRSFTATETLSYPVFTTANPGWISWILLVGLAGGGLYAWLCLRRDQQRVPGLVTAAIVSSLLLALVMLWRPANNFALNFNPAGWLLLITTILVSLIAIRLPGQPLLLGQMNTAIIRLQGAEKIIEASPAAARLLGLTAAATATGQPLRALLPLTGPAQDGFEFSLPAAPEHVWQLCQLPWPNPVFPGETLWTIEDITASKESTQHQDQMLRKVIHDLRNPLSSSLTMLGFLEKQSGRLTPERQRQMVSLATRSLDRGIGLVNRLADIQRLETDDLPLEQEIIDLPLLVDKAQSNVLSQYREKELAIYNDVEIDLPPVWADPRVLEQVLLDLLRNAAQFTPKGGEISIKAQVRFPAVDADSNEGSFAPTLTERSPAPGAPEAGGSTAEPLPGPFIEVAIGDSGPGIPETLRPRLFQKFETGNLAGQGTGLGLAYCRLALAAHGQAIWIDDRFDQGACFIFTLAVATEASTGEDHP